ncbi:MAG: hypothetical protein R6V60_20025 [Desulfobacterales bacterium]
MITRGIQDLNQKGITHEMVKYDHKEKGADFAARAVGFALACMRELGIDKEKCNLVGGGVSISHPIGCTGARITYSLAMQLKKSGKTRGLASLCIGGGQGFSMVLESL